MKTALSQFRKEIREDVSSRKALSILSAGFVAGLGLVFVQISFAVLIFSGELAPFVSYGVGLILFGNFATCLILSLSSGYRGTIAGLSPALVLGMSVLVAGINTEQDNLFVNAATALIITACVAGFTCFFLGAFRIAESLRFIPYPVIAGFVAGIGGAVCVAAFTLMGTNLNLNGLLSFTHYPSVLLWTSGAGYGMLLYWATKRWRTTLFLPVSLLVVVGLFHLGLYTQEISVAMAQSKGFLLTANVGSDIWPVLSLSDLQLLDWTAILRQIPDMLVLVVVAIIAFVMNIAGLEVATQEKLSWNSEFKVGGLSSIVAGLGGGTVSTIVVPASQRNKLLGANSRLTGVCAALVVGSVLLFGGGLFGLVPTPVLGGLVIFAGLGMLEEGLLRSYLRLPISEFLIVVLMMIAIIGFGLLEAVAIGMLTTLVFFVLRLSKLDPLAMQANIKDQRSTQIRSMPDHVILTEIGQHARIVYLQGYIFFGSVNTLVNKLNTITNEPHRCNCILLSFQSVSGVDYSAISVLSKWFSDEGNEDIEIVLCIRDSTLQREFERHTLSSTKSKLTMLDTIDKALKFTEDIVISSWRESEVPADQQRETLLRDVASKLDQQLLRQSDFEELIDELQSLFQISKIEVGELLFKGESENGLHILKSGHASVIDEKGNRILQRRTGDSFDEKRHSAFGTVQIIADEPCEVLSLSEKGLSQLEVDQPELTLRLYRYLLRETSVPNYR